MPDLRVYEDRPEYGLIIKLIIVLVPGSLLIGSLFMSLQGDVSGAQALLAEGLFIVLLFYFIFPRSYQIYPDHLRIALGGPFSVKVRFDNIKSAEVSTDLSFGVNFATTLTRRYVKIVRIKGMRIAITPKAPEQFVENLERALALWRKQSSLILQK